MAASPVSLSVRLQNALNQPILQIRCEEVGRILNETTSKDASIILRTVVENIFGLNGQLGWGLRTITHSTLPREFEQLRSFLSATGPILSLTYRLANDPFMMFEFPVAWLPAKSKAEIEEGVPGNFYMNKVQNPGPGKSPTHILLSAFEYYFFHYANFLVNNSCQRWALSWTTSGDALYPCLLEDYLRVFLPCDNSVPPGPPSPPVSPRGVLSPVSPRTNVGSSGSNALYMSNLVSPIQWRPVRSGVSTGYPSMASDRTGATSSSPLQAVHSPHPQLSIWTSQVIIQVLVEMWVHQCLPSTRSPSRSPPHTSTNSPPGGQELFVPSSDHVRVVRMLIKHLHFFSNSAKSGQPSPLDDLRKNLWGMYRKSLYQFLRHTFSHWPLDSSFRLVLETWLSYIQPWRYTEYANVIRSPPQSTFDFDTQRVVEAKWQGFVAENLLFYSLLFYHLLCRLFRLDLSAPKNAQILFRVAKVFSQPNLCSFIREIEEALEDPHFMHRSLIGSDTPHPLGGGITSGLHGDHFPARSLASVARAHFTEMEGPSHTYMAMFSQANVTVVESLLKHICRAHGAVFKEHQLLNYNGNGASPSAISGKEGWWSTFKSLFEASSPSEDDTTAEDIRKTVNHLENSQRQLSSIFNIMVPLEYGQTIIKTKSREDDFSHTSSSFLSPIEDPASPQHMQTPSGPRLTNYGRYQLLTGFRRLDLKYEGDPDLKPICTYEIAFLVRWLYALVLLLNTKYGQKMAALYSRGDLVGWMVRLILKAPERVYEYHKSSWGSPHSRMHKDLPPRLSLRFQASKHVIGYEVAFSLLFYILGLWNLIFSSLLIFLALVFSYYLLSSYFTHPYRHQAENLLQAEQSQEVS
ncbi:sphingomyelin phosphodiesterase 4, neutral membrane (neutral sphingomyelinase-3) [Halocaridina rubra]|uniref:Sphingomyelin phosphodiesterase 4, neutral membrane (Neutral sphingomyelinase-3) n=1 Tax=Halocaridina rubra TaxID=373956 RepID=A0AAN8XK83_HALRR